MEGENFESTGYESSVDTQSYEAPASTDSYEGSYESDSSSDGGYDGDYEGSYDESSGQSGEQTIASARSAEGTSFELYTDPVTGKTEFRVTSGEPETQAPEGTPEEGFDDDNYEEEDQEGLSREINEAVENVNGEVYEYTLDEFSQALASGIVDERRVPEEYQKQYADFKIEQARNVFNDRVRQQRQMMEYQAQQQAQQEAMLQQQLMAQQTPEARAAANQEFYNALDSEAEKLAMQDLGVTPKIIEDIEYEDEEKAAEIRQRVEVAKAWHRQDLTMQLQERQRAEEAYRYGQQQLYNQINAFTRQAAAEEPHFAEIDKMLETAWREMPTKYGAVVKGALDSLARGTCTPEEAAVVKKYYEDTRKLYYAQKNGFSATGQAKPRPVKKRPPMVERAGNGQAGVNKGPDYAALRNADARGKKAWLSEFFKGIEL